LNAWITNGLGLNLENEAAGIIINGKVFKETGATPLARCKSRRPLISTPAAYFLRLRSNRTPPNNFWLCGVTVGRSKTAYSGLGTSRSEKIPVAFERARGLRHVHHSQRECPRHQKFRAFLHHGSPPIQCPPGRISLSQTRHSHFIRPVGPASDILPQSFVIH